MSRFTDKKYSGALSVLLTVAMLAGCGGGGGDTDTPSTTTPVVSLPSPTLFETSYANFKSNGLTPRTLPSGDNTMRAYGDFAGNGRFDLFRAIITYDVSQPVAQATPSRFEFYSQQADGSYALNTTLLANADGCIHPRKAIVADFNKDNRPDVFVACHGYDATPFPGETSKVVLSQSDGSYLISDASSDVGFNHGASAADLNGDGFIDVVVVNNFETNRAYTLLNDGTGHFVRETTSRLPASIQNGGNFYSVELVDMDEDGKLDLLLGGHELDTPVASTSIFLNPGSNDFSAVTPITVPAVANEGVVFDFTVTGTGSNRTLWVLRTSGGDGTFYQSKTVQKVSYPAMTSSVVLNERPAQWIPWLIPASVNGVTVITSDNLADGVSVLMD